MAKKSKATTTPKPTTTTPAPDDGRSADDVLTDLQTGTTPAPDAVSSSDCPHAAPHRYCETCKVDPCPIGLGTTPAPTTTTTQQPGTTTPPRPKVAAISVRLPYDQDHAAVTFQGHIDAKLNGRQMTALKRIASAADQAGATLENGKRVTVDRYVNALRWLLEQVAEQAEG